MANTCIFLISHLNPSKAGKTRQNKVFILHRSPAPGSRCRLLLACGAGFSLGTERDSLHKDTADHVLASKFLVTLVLQVSLTNAGGSGHKDQSDMKEIIKIVTSGVVFRPWLCQFFSLYVLCIG